MLTPHRLAYKLSAFHPSDQQKETGTSLCPSWPFCRAGGWRKHPGGRVPHRSGELHPIGWEGMGKDARPPAPRTGTPVSPPCRPVPSRPLLPLRRSMVPEARAAPAAPGGAGGRVAPVAAARRGRVSAAERPIASSAPPSVHGSAEHRHGPARHRQPCWRCVSNPADGRGLCPNRCWGSAHLPPTPLHG